MRRPPQRGYVRDGRSAGDVHDGRSAGDVLDGLMDEAQPRTTRERSAEHVPPGVCCPPLLEQLHSTRSAAIEQLFSSPTGPIATQIFFL